MYLHHFELSEDKFNEVAGDKFLDWVKYAGVYFRFPTYDNEDIYWDDDYDDPERTKEWARGMGWTGRMSKPENML